VSGKARLGTSKLQAPTVRREDLDDNISTYRLEADGRSAEERVQYVRLDRIEPSPFQVRRVFPEAEIEELADSIRDNGLVHQPKGRPHPTKPDWIELMPGELRLRALQRLLDRGEADRVLKCDSGGNWLAPVTVVAVDDERAESIVFAENEARTDLSAWEWALAWQQRRDRRQERGQPATIRDVAAAHNRPYQTVGEYLKVADGLTLEVLAAAGVIADGGPDHSRMGRLSFSTLKGVAATAAQSVDAAATHLLQELRRVGDHAATERLQSRQASARRGPSAGKQSFQINIRQPLPELTPQQATHYLSRISAALPILAERAAHEIGTESACELATTLEQTAKLLRQRG
jgi:ParB-like chromosome segregation protein Spo0J